MEPNDRAERLSARPYSEFTLPDETTTGNPIWVAFTPELPGCMVQAEVEPDALRELREWRPEYIEHLLNAGLSIPPPALAAYLATWQHEDELEPEPETTALVARQHGRQFIGCDLNPEYVAIARRRLALPYTPNMFLGWEGTH